MTAPTSSHTLPMSIHHVTAFTLRIGDGTEIRFTFPKAKHCEQQGPTAKYLDLLETLAAEIDLGAVGLRVSMVAAK